VKDGGGGATCQLNFGTVEGTYDGFMVASSTLDRAECDQVADCDLRVGYYRLKIQIGNDTGQ
jgi:hypothetical protein